VSDHWDFYFSELNEKTASTFVDLGIRQQVPDRSRPWLVILDLYMVSPRADGLSDRAEYDTLIRIEDLITAALAEHHRAEHVGRITYDGRRIMHFYAPQEFDPAPTVRAALKDYPEYRFDTSCEHDPDWDTYQNDLYPSDEEMETIKNLKVLDALQDNGDPLKAARPVDHWAYFPTESGRDAFKAGAEKLGYKAEVLKPSDAFGKNRFGIQLTRTDHVDFDSINDVTLELFRLAQEFNGEYDGWETQVVK